MARRETPEISSGAMADIAFMLLIFFLVATTMDVDSGLARMLPPKLPQDMETPPQVKDRNVFVVQINSQDRVAIKGEPIDISELKEKAKEFISNPARKITLPEFEVKDITVKNSDGVLIMNLGPHEVSKGVISLQNDNGTSYEVYIAVQDALVRAYNELRDELSKQKFQKKFDDLDENEMKAIKKIIPQKISEAEPRNIGK
jgi:biopolymer transport protein ExbD